MLIHTFTVFWILQILPFTAAFSLDGAGLMQRVNARSRGNASQMRLEMTLHDSRRGDFHKTLVMQRKRLPAGYRTTYWITSPDHEKGIGLLLSEDASRESSWMYFPGPRQVIPVASRGFPALGSDFSTEDLLMGLPQADYQFRILGQERSGMLKLTKVEMKPRTERLRRELGFAKSVGWVRDDIWLIVRADYFDEKGVLIKRFRVDNLEQVQGIWTPRKFIMENYRAEHSSEVTVAEADYSIHLSDDAFTPAALGAGLPASFR